MPSSAHSGQPVVLAERPRCSDVGRPVEEEPVDRAGVRERCRGCRRPGRSVGRGRSGCAMRGRSAVRPRAPGTSLWRVRASGVGSGRRGGVPAARRVAGTRFGAVCLAPTTRCPWRRGPCLVRPRGCGLAGLRADLVSVGRARPRLVWPRMWGPADDTDRPVSGWSRPGVLASHGVVGPARCAGLASWGRPCGVAGRSASSRSGAGRRAPPVIRGWADPAVRSPSSAARPPTRAVAPGVAVPSPPRSAACPRPSPAGGSAIPRRAGSGLCTTVCTHGRTCACAPRAAKSGAGLISPPAVGRSRRSGRGCAGCGALRLSAQARLGVRSPGRRWRRSDRPAGSRWAGST